MRVELIDVVAGRVGGFKSPFNSRLKTRNRKRKACYAFRVDDARRARYGPCRRSSARAAISP